MDKTFIVRTLVGALAIIGVGACVYYFSYSRKPVDQFDLISDSSAAAGQVTLWNDRQKVHERIRADIQQRLQSAYFSLAYADSGKWSLATWAQLQSIRDTLDGLAGDPEVVAKRDAVLRDFGFARLLNELVETAPQDQKQAAFEAKRDGMAIIEELARMTPNTPDPRATLKHIVSKIETAPGLRSFVSGFPRYSDIPIPED